MVKLFFFFFVFIGAFECGFWASGDLRFECVVLSTPEHTRPIPLILFLHLGGLGVEALVLPGSGQVWMSPS